MARPRLYPEGATATDRQRARRARLTAERAGETRLDVMISAASRAALDALKRPGETDREAIERLLIAGRGGWRPDTAD